MKTLSQVGGELKLQRGLLMSAIIILESPIKRVATLDTPLPFAPIMEQAVVPSVERIRTVILSLFE